MSEREASVAVLGAGLQGSCVALELARRGHEVVLLDQDAVPMNRAGLRNEGKIHLGLIYANDPTLATARLQLEGALSFRTLLARWLGTALDDLHLATPFVYLVARDSLLQPEALAEHYSRVEALYAEQRAERPDLDYLGTRPERLAWRLAPEKMARYFREARFLAGFGTAELAVDTDQLARLVREAIARAPGIRFLPGRRVEAVARTSGGFAVEGGGPEGPWRIEAAQVVNATWESRLALDRGFGLEIGEGWVHRLKYRVIARLPEALAGAPSVTMVLGPYGDVVVRPDGTAYLSWYPLGLKGWSHDVRPPAAWDAPCRGEVDAAEAREFSAAVLQAIDAWYPGIGSSEPILVDAGAIVAYGKTDVDDAASGLHDRTRIGVTSADGYHSVDPGKLTTAPLFAMAVADRVTEAAGRPGAAGGASSAAKETGAVRPPRVVACMPAYNGDSFITATLDSLAAQTYPNLEILVSDDASTDGTAAICARYAAEDERFRLIRQERNLGWVGNVNALLRAAEGDYLMLAFHDDLLMPTYVARLVEALEANPDAILAFSDVELVTPKGRRRRRVFAALDGVEERTERARRMLLQPDAWAVPNRGVFRAEAARRIGGLKRHLAGEFSADWPWLLHMAILGAFVRVPEQLGRKVMRQTNLSRSWSYNTPSFVAVSLSCAREIRRSDLSFAEEIPLYGVLLHRCLGRLWQSARVRLERRAAAPGGQAG